MGLSDKQTSIRKIRELVHLIRTEMDREEDFNTAIGKVNSSFTVCELWVTQMLNVMHILDEELYEWFSYYFFECGWEWKVLMHGTEYTFSTDDEFIDFICELKKSI